MIPNPLRPLTFTVLLALGALAGCGGGGGQPQVPLEPPTNLTAAWSPSLPDSVRLTWTAPAHPVDGFIVECRIGSGDYTKLDAYGLYNSAWTWGEWPIKVSDIPERTTLTFRLSSRRGSATSAYTNEASVITPLRAPGRPEVTAVTGGYRISWINRSVMADTLTLERGVPTTSNPDDAVWTRIPSVSFGALDYTDLDAPEGVNICYRVTYATVAASVSSTSLVLQNAVNGPINLAATPGVERVRLTWTNRSTVAGSVVVSRAPALGASPTFLPIATLPPTATSFDDIQLPTGYYTYRLEALAAGASAGAPSPAVKVATLPPAVPGLALVPSIIPGMPTGYFGALTPQGTWFLGVPPGSAKGCQVFYGADGTWASQAFGSATVLASPGLVSDPQGHPHLVFTRAVAQGSRQVALVHAWYDGRAWRDEEITQTTLYTNAAVPVFVLPQGSQHPSVLFLASTLDLTYVTWAEDGTWQTETLASILPAGFVCDRVSMTLDGAGAPVVLAEGYPRPQVLRRTGANAWIAEALPSSLADYQGAGALVATADGDLHLFLGQQQTFLSSAYNLLWSRRSGGEWSAPAVLADLSTYPDSGTIQATANPEGTRVIVACPTSLGSTLLVYAQGAWNHVALGPHPARPLLGFMADGKLRLLRLSGLAYPNGWSDYVLYTEM